MLRWLESVLHDEPWVYSILAAFFVVACGFVLYLWTLHPSTPLFDGLLYTLIVPAVGFVWYARRNKDNPFVHPAIRRIGWLVTFVWIASLVLRSL
jgi:hypothetical protein